VRRRSRRKIAGSKTRRLSAPALAAHDRRLEDSPAQDVSNKAGFVGLSPRLLSIGLSP
jgi:HPt (histidine-containing phosphotransfer) domain-containing protein